MSDPSCIASIILLVVLLTPVVAWLTRKAYFRYKMKERDISRYLPVSKDDEDSDLRPLRPEGTIV